MQKLKIRANILFAGIGCQERGFEDSGVIDLDVLSISEIDKNAVLSYAAILKAFHLSRTGNISTREADCPKVCLR